MEPNKPGTYVDYVDRTELQSLIEEYCQVYKLMTRLFTYAQIEEINYGIDHDLPWKEIESFANPRLSYEEMHKILRKKLNKHITKEKKLSFFHHKKKW